MERSSYPCETHMGPGNCVGRQEGFPCTLTAIMVVCVRVYAHVCVFMLYTRVPQHLGGGQRTTCRRWFFPSTVKASGTKFGLSALVASASTH